MAGAVCGIGGGVLIKPVLDMFGVLGVAGKMMFRYLSGLAGDKNQVGAVQWERRLIAG